jgi:hypothetical protein
MKVKKSDEEELKVLCSLCNNNTRHSIISSIESEGKEDWGEDGWYHWMNKYQIIECKGCGTISFKHDHTNSENFDHDGKAMPWFENVYPKRSSLTKQNKDFLNVPFTLKRIYKETIDCYNNDNLTLCCAGVRTLVEGICIENNILDGEIEYTKKDGTNGKRKSKDLKGKIIGLYQSGKLTKGNVDILHEHRFLGNYALHEFEIPAKNDLKLAIEIIEHLLDNLYEIPNKARMLKRKRLSRIE